MSCSVSGLLCLFLCVAVTSGNEHGPHVITEFVSEWSGAVLPCSLYKENLEDKQFSWIKDDNQTIFWYDAGFYQNNSRPGQDELSEERVSHFPEQLKSGVASIKFNFIKLEDAGNYTCVIPHLQQEKERVKIRLVVEPILRDRSLEIPDAIVKPFARILDTSVDGVLLRCEVHGAATKPTLRWTDADGNVLPTKELKVYEKRGRYFAFLLVAVNQTIDNFFRCEATQEEISHRVHDDVSVPEQLFESCPDVFMWIAVWFSGVLSLAAVLALVACAKCIRKRSRKGSRWQDTDWSFEPQLKR